MNTWWPQATSINQDIRSGHCSMRLIHENKKIQLNCMSNIRNNLPVRAIELMIRRIVRGFTLFKWSYDGKIDPKPFVPANGTFKSFCELKCSKFSRLSDKIMLWILINSPSHLLLSLHGVFNNKLRFTALSDVSS